MGRDRTSPLERTSVQLMIGVAIIALCANSAVDRTDDGLPWEVTLGGFCMFAVIFSAVYAKKTDVALGIVGCAPAPAARVAPTHAPRNPAHHSRLCHRPPSSPPARSIFFVLMPTYFVHNYEVAAVNWQLGSLAPLSATKGELLTAVWKDAPNSSKWDTMLGLDAAGLSLMSFSMFNPGIALKLNTSEVYHSGLKLDDPLTKQRSHDYLLFTSPRKVATSSRSRSPARPPPLSAPPLSAQTPPPPRTSRGMGIHRAPSRCRRRCGAERRASCCWRACRQSLTCGRRRAQQRQSGRRGGGMAGPTISSSGRVGRLGAALRAREETYSASDPTERPWPRSQPVPHEADLRSVCLTR